MVTSILTIGSDTYTFNTSTLLDSGIASLPYRINSDSKMILLPNKPTDRYSPNAIARISPKSSRDAALQAYVVWQKGNVGTSESTKFSNIIDGDASDRWGGKWVSFTDGTTLGYIWFQVEGDGFDQGPGGTVNFGLVNVFLSDTGREIVAKIETVFRSLSNTTVDFVGDHEIHVTNRIPGVRADADTSIGISLIPTVTTQGVDPVATAWDGTYNDGDPQNLVYDNE